MIALGNVIYFLGSTELERTDMKRTTNNSSECNMLIWKGQRKMWVGLTAHTIYYILCNISVNHHWAYMKNSKWTVTLTQYFRMDRKATVTRVREICLWATVAPPSLIVADDCDSVQPSGINKLPVFPVCLSICANEIQYDFKSVRNEIHFQSNNC